MVELEIRLLGEFELLVDGERVDVSGNKPRQLLACMAAEAGVLLPADQIIAALWSDDLDKHPDHSNNALKTYISRARTALGPYRDLLRFEVHGYCLELSTTDVIEFHATIGRADASSGSEAIGELRRGLALWRGKPFSGVDGSPMIDDHIRRLDEAHVGATEMLGDLLLEAGHFAEVIELLRPLKEEHPYRETLAMSLGRAFAATGQRHEAIDVLADLRSSLREAGMDVGHVVAGLEQEILSGALDLRVQAPLFTRTEREFVGRFDDLEVVQGAVDARTSLLMVGEAGIGKSSLVQKLQEHLDKQGAPHVSVRARPEPAQPLATVREILEALHEIEPIRPSDESQRSACGRLLPEMMPDQADSAVELSRDQFMSQLVAVIVDCCDRQSCVIVVDDCHDLDVASLAVVRLLVDSGTCLICTSRPPAEDHDDRYLGLGTAMLILDIPPLSFAESQLLMRQRAGRPPSERVAGDLHHRSGGNPFFLGMLLDLREDGALIEGELPASVLAAVADRLQGLSTQAIRTLETAAILGSNFDLRHLNMLRPTAEADLEQSERLGLVHRRGDRVDFTHQLVVESITQILPAARRINLHQSVGDALEIAEASAIEFAPHFLAAASLDAGRAVRAALSAAEQHTERHGLDAAIDVLRQAVRTTKDHPVGRNLLVELVVTLGKFERLAADPGHVETLALALELGRDSGEADLVARAVIELSSHGQHTEAGRSDRGTLDLLVAALDSDLSPRIRVELLAAAPTLLAASGRDRESRAHYSEALDLMSPMQDPGLEARVLSNLHLGMACPDDYERRLRLADRFSELAGTDVDLCWEVDYLQFWHQTLAADADGMTATITRLRKVDPNAAHRHVGLAHVEAAYAQALGRYGAAEALIDDAYERAVAVFPHSWAFNHSIVLLFAVRLGQGRLAELYEAMQQTVSDLAETPNWRAGLALIAWEAGEQQVAQREFEALAVDDFSLVSKDLSWTGTLAALARLAAASGREREAETLYRALLPHQHRLAWGGAATFGSIAGPLASCAELAGARLDADGHRTVAGEIERRLEHAIYVPPPV